MTCTVCNNKLSKRQTKFCSETCQRKAWKLNNRDAYLAGKKAYRGRNHQKILEYNRRRKLLYGELKAETATKLKERYACLRCNSKDRLNVHHIKHQSFGIDNSYGNLIVLCWDCHMSWHKTISPLLNSFWLSR